MGFCFPFLYPLKKKPSPKDNSHRTQSCAQAENSKQHKPAIVCAGNNGSFWGELIKKCTLGLWAHMQGEFCYQPAPPGTSSPLLHHNTDNELQLQRDTTENKEINSRLVHDRVDAGSDLQVVSEYLIKSFFTKAPLQTLFFSWSLHQCFASLEFSF